MSHQIENIINQIKKSKRSSRDEKYNNWNEKFTERKEQKIIFKEVVAENSPNLINVYTSKRFKELQVNKLKRIIPRHIIMKMLEDRENLEKYLSKANSLK